METDTFPLSSFLLELQPASTTDNFRKSLSRKYDHLCEHLISRVNENESLLQKKVQEKEEVLNELSRLREEKVKLSLQNKQLKTEIKELEKKWECKEKQNELLHVTQSQYICRENQARSNISSKDLDTIRSLEEKIKFYKFMTGTVLKVDNPNDSPILGYIHCKNTNKVKSLKIDTSNKSLNEISTELWALVGKTSTE